MDIGRIAIKYKKAGLSDEHTRFIVRFAFTAEVIKRMEQYEKEYYGSINIKQNFK